MKYKFPVDEFSAADGYTRLVVSNGEADIDPADKALVALAEACNGVPVKAPAKGKKGK